MNPFINTVKNVSAALLISTALVMPSMAEEFSTESSWHSVAKDAWIDGKAEATLLYNGNLNAFDIITDVDQGVVLLTGRVSNSVEKSLAEELVRGIDGVKGVENQIQVVESSQVEPNNSEVVSTITDAKIATVVKSRLLMDSDISGFDIHVDVKKGQVLLEGDVNSEAERDLALQIARNTNDVVNVQDQLNVASRL